MIQIAFKNGSVLVESGSSVNDVPVAIQSACSKLSVEIEQVEAVSFPGSECCEPDYVTGLLNDIKQKIRKRDEDEAIRFAINTLRQYANSENWSGVSNRHQILQRRWKGGGEGADLAKAALDRLQKYESCARLDS